MATVTGELNGLSGIFAVWTAVLNTLANLTIARWMITFLRLFMHLKNSLYLGFLACFLGSRFGSCYWFGSGDVNLSLFAIAVMHAGDSLRVEQPAQSFTCCSENFGQRIAKDVAIGSPPQTDL
jgi:hypothetical protein